MNLSQARHPSDLSRVISSLRAALPGQPATAELPSDDFWRSRRIHPLVKKAAESLFESGHYAQAATEALKALDRATSKKAGLSSSGVAMMRAAFSPEGPRLKWNDFRGLSARDQQDGYMQLFAGAIAGIRNPRAHEPGHIDDRETCEDVLVVASHLAKKLDLAVRARPSKARPALRRSR